MKFSKVYHAVTKALREPFFYSDKSYLEDEGGSMAIHGAGGG